MFNSMYITLDYDPSLQTLCTWSFLIAANISSACPGVEANNLGIISDSSLSQSTANISDIPLTLLSKCIKTVSVLCHRKCYNISVLVPQSPK